MKKSSYKIATVLGIPIYLHISLIVILPFLAWSFADNFKSLADLAEVSAGSLNLSPYFWGFLMAVALFVSITLHELGHSVAAMAQKINIRGINLMLFGGVAQLERMPEKFGREAIIAVAGPLVSIALGLLFFLSGIKIPAGMWPNLHFVFIYLGIINWTLAGFNLLPAFPMDGGRILRSLLVKKFQFVRATQIAATVGKIFAVLFGIYGLFNSHFMLVLIALFIYSGASQEAAAAKQQDQGPRLLQVQDLMFNSYEVLPGDMPVKDLLNKFSQAKNDGYPVGENKRIIGIVSEEMVAGLAPHVLEGKTVRDIMSNKILTISPNEELYVAFQQMTENGVEHLVVTEQGRLIGLLSKAEIMRVLKFRKIMA